MTTTPTKELPERRPKPLMTAINRGRQRAARTGAGKPHGTTAQRGHK